MANPGETKGRVYKNVYSATFLSRVYDYYVLGFNFKYMWGCGTSVMVPFFSDNFSHRHLDIGVANGYFPAVILSRPMRSLEKHQLTLLDFNQTSLNAAKARVLSAAPHTAVQCVQADVTAQLPESLEDVHKQYDSITMFNLFHCIPGGLGKLRAFSTYKELLSDDGVLTGCTILGRKHATGWLSRLYLRFYNWVDFFNNWDDDQEAFERVLKQEFEEVETELVGMVLLFKASKPRSSHLTS
ncbi:methyltransferase [Xylariales sp. AK1849]|nr:methyltransferase [Xylariales sp. AK1849]